MSEDNNTDDSDLINKFTPQASSPHHSPPSSYTRHSTAQWRKSYSGHSLFTQRPHSINLASDLEPVSDSPQITHISSDEDVANDESFNDRSFDEINRLEEFIASEHIQDQPDISDANDHVIISGPSDDQDHQSDCYSSDVEEALDVLSGESGLFVSNMDSDMSHLTAPPTPPFTLQLPNREHGSHIRGTESVTIDHRVWQKDAVSSTTGTSSPASDASDVLPYTCIPSTSARGGTPFHASPSPMNSRVPSNVNLPTHSNHCPLEVPIVGYEIMDQRARFTVFKIQVKRHGQSWYIFRRYSDFWRLNEQLRVEVPQFRLTLPPKRFFGNNFEIPFLEERLIGLQAFLNNIVGHQQVYNCATVHIFFCLNDPPGPYDSLEESMAQCELLEDRVYNLQREIQERDSRVDLLNEELVLRSTEIENLRRSLRIEQALNTECRSPMSQQSECSLPEHEQGRKPYSTQAHDVTWEAPLSTSVQQRKLHAESCVQLHSTPNKFLDSDTGLTNEDIAGANLANHVEDTFESVHGNDVSGIIKVIDHLDIVQSEQTLLNGVQRMGLNNDNITEFSRTDVK